MQRGNRQVVFPLFKGPEDAFDQAETCVRKLVTLANLIELHTQDLEPGSEDAEVLVDDLEVSVEQLAAVLGRLRG
ncbi:hypothetical protein [Streptomyces sp. NPDC056169]|uniref:hypothetical protein n=1 Tax=Streptomyces sp. NPDC056169 TaxID=3345734 RepID=UPI0035DAC044